MRNPEPRSLAASALVGYLAIASCGGAGDTGDGETASASSEYVVERMYRDTRIMSPGGGTQEIMKEIISKRLGF